MFDPFKAAAAAAFLFGATATTGALGTGAVTASPAVMVTVGPVPTATTVTPLPNGDVVIAPQTADPADAPIEAPAASLAALVRRHLAGATADAEMECLAGAVYFESKGEPLEGQLAVANVILNRAGSGRFPASACGVVRQRGQFSFVRGNGFPPIARNSLAWKRAVAIAHIAQAELWKPAASNALYFHARRVSPAWGRTRVASLGNHVFYR